MKNTQVTVTDAGTAPRGDYKDDTREIVTSLIRHALEDCRLAEITASRNSHWHIADACRNLAIAADKLLASIPLSL